MTITAPSRPRLRMILFASAGMLAFSLAIRGWLGNRSEAARPELPTEEAPSCLETSDSLWSWDAGSVTPGTQLTHAFHFVNCSTESLRILRVEKSCNCMDAVVTRMVIAPGEESAVLVQATVETRTDRFETFVTLHCDPPVTPSQSRFHVRAMVHSLGSMELDSPIVDLGSFDAEAPPTAIVRLQLASPPGTLPLELDWKTLGSNPRLDLEARAIDSTDSSRRTYEIEVTPRPGTVGRFEESVALRASTAPGVEDRLTLRGFARDFVSLAAPVVYLGSVALDSRLEHAIPIAWVDKSAPRPETQVQPAWLSATFIPSGENNEGQSVLLAGQPERAGPVRGSLTFLRGERTVTYPIVGPVVRE